MITTGPLDRRTFLAGLGAAALAVACSDSDTADSASTTDATSAASTTTTTTASETTAETTAAPTTSAAEVAEAAGLEPLTPAMFDALAVCTLLPAQAEGPFPTIDELDRRVIHEGYPGQPLRLGMRVVDDTCSPVPGAVVEVWHCDASGDYSSYTDGGSGKDEGEGSTFCRGFQTSDADGILEFETIFPGWYEGRAVHIHTTVHLDGERKITGQLYFDETYTAEVFRTGEYAQFGPPDTPVGQDFLAGDPSRDGTGILASDAMTGIGPGTLGLINLGIDPT